MRLAFPILCLSLAACAAHPPEARPQKLSLVGSERDPRTWRCEGLRTPAQLCASYEATPALRQDPNVQRARHMCLRFYEAAVRGANLLCGYVKEMDALLDEGDGQSSYLLTARGKYVHRRYSDRAEDVIRELDFAFLGRAVGGTQRATDDLERAGRQNLDRELACEEEPTVEEAPGLYLLGLSDQAARDQAATYQNVRHGLNRLIARLQISSDMLLEVPTTGKPVRAPASEQDADHVLRTSNPRTISGRVAAYLRGDTLDGLALLRVGQARAPRRPGVEAEYERLAAEIDPARRKVYQAPATGRGLASVKCPRRAR